MGFSPRFFGLYPISPCQVKCFAVPEGGVPEGCRLEVPDPGGGAHQGVRHHQVDDGEFLRNKGLDLIEKNLPRMVLDCQHLFAHQAVEACFPRRGGLWL